MSTPSEASMLLAELLNPANRADPYPLYARIRQSGPLLQPQGRAVVLSSHADCMAILHDPCASNDRRNLTVLTSRCAQRHPRKPKTSKVIGTGTPSFLFLDPPEHTRLRRLVAGAFAPKIISQLEPWLRELIDELIDDLGAAARDGVPIDLVKSVAYPLPVAMICRLLGIPREHEAQFRIWSERVAGSLDAELALIGAPDQGSHEQAITVIGELNDYLHQLVLSRRAKPGSDLLSALIAAEQTGALTNEELIATCLLLLVGGHETTVNLIANAVLALLRHPDQWDALRTDPNRAGNVVEETLRYDPPVHVVVRVATRDIELGGQTAQAGGLIVLLLGATGRDPALVAEPERFDPDREHVRTLAFGMGPHFCIGAALARLEARLVVSQLTERLIGTFLAEDPPPYKPNIVFRGMSELPIHVDYVRPRANR